MSWIRSGNLANWAGRPRWWVAQICTEHIEPKPTFRGFLFAREVAAEPKRRGADSFPDYPGGVHDENCCLYRLPYPAGYCRCYCETG